MCSFHLNFSQYVLANITDDDLLLSIEWEDDELAVVSDVEVVMSRKWWQLILHGIGMAILEQN